MIVELFGELSADNFEIETKEVYFLELCHHKMSYIIFNVLTNFRIKKIHNLQAEVLLLQMILQEQQLLFNLCKNC